MSDSSDNNELFGSDSEDKKEDQEDSEGDSPPAYTETDEFKNFVSQNRINVHSKYGYIFCHVYKPFYFPGEIVRGSIILDLFNPLPKTKNQINLRFSGREMVGKHFENVKSSFRKKSSMR